MLVTVKPNPAMDSDTYSPPLKGIATVRLPNGAQREVELHWYEAHGIGKRDLKIKRYLDEK